jgi:hypothetical protein
MKKIILATLALMLFASGAAAQTATAQDPQALRALFDRWGYQPEPVSMTDGHPLIRMNVDGVATVVGVGGCTDGRACTYIVLIAVYDDVVNPPFEWLNAQNNDYDLVTATRSDEGMLSLRAGITLGTAGIPEATLRAALADWVAANNEIAQRAVQAGLARE